jgi:hypothetical protein
MSREHLTAAEVEALVESTKANRRGHQSAQRRHSSGNAALRRDNRPYDLMRCSDQDGSEAKQTKIMVLHIGLLQKLASGVGRDVGIGHIAEDSVQVSSEAGERQAGAWEGISRPPPDVRANSLEEAVASAQ